MSITPTNPRPPGKGLGECPNLTRVAWGRGRLGCGCRARCRVCGYPKHSAVHMHVKGEAPGDPPFDHEYEPKP